MRTASEAAPPRMAVETALPYTAAEARPRAVQPARAVE